MDLTVDEKLLENLFRKASEASEYSYSPYSKFPVGAALVTQDGAVYTGCNIENRSFGLTNCAERTALFKAVSDGKTEFVALAVATPKSDYPVAPCGACRQVLTEFASADMPVLFGNTFSNAVRTTLGKLYPFDSLHELADE